MNDPVPSTLLVDESDMMPVEDRADLIPDVNRAFLMAKQILPIGLDQERLLCLTAHPDDEDARDAIRFASGRDVTFIAASPQAIARAFSLSATPPRQADVAPGRFAAVPHAREVLWLRTFLTGVMESGADALMIQRAGSAILRLDGRDIDWRSIDPAQAGRLIAAIDALVDADPPGKDEPGFDIVIGKAPHRAQVTGAPDHRLLGLRAA